MELSEAEKFFHQGHIYSGNPIVILSYENIGCIYDFCLIFDSVESTLAEVGGLFTVKKE